MASPTRRRPLPAVVLLAALTALTALVWVRVLNRDTGHASTSVPCRPLSSTAALLPQPATVSVSVLNSTSRNGIAKSTAATLTKLGFKVTGAANDNPDVHVASVAEIRFGPDQKQDAALLAFYFPGAKMVALTSDPTGIVIVSLGAKFIKVATGKAALAAIRAAHVTLAPTSSPSSVPTGGQASCAGT
jgi:hypothetical protein